MSSSILLTTNSLGGGVLARMIWILVPSLVASLISGWAIVAWTSAGYPVGILVAVASGVGIGLLLCFGRRSRLGASTRRTLSGIKAKRDITIRKVNVGRGQGDEEVLSDIESRQGGITLEDVDSSHE